MNTRRYTISWVIAIASLFSLTRSASAFNIFIGDTNPGTTRANFNNSFNTNSTSTSIDNGTTGFAGAAPSVSTGLTSVSRSGIISGSNFTYSIYDINFSNSPTGMLSPGSAGGDIASLDKINIEQPATQDTARGNYVWGVDNASGSSLTRNAALFNFNQSIGHFGIDLHDFEAGLNDTSSGASGAIRLYKNGVLSQNIVLQFPGPATGTDNPNNLTPIDSTYPGFGNKQSKFVGIIANHPNEFFNQVVFLLGDDDLGDNGYTEQWAADGFTFGTAYQQGVPFEFKSSLGLLLVGSFWGLNRLWKKFRQNV